MRIFRIISILFLTYHYCSAQNTNEQLLAELDEVIENRELYTKMKLLAIDSLKKELSLPGQSLNETFRHYHHLNAEYETFKFDSAFLYACKLIEIAYLTNQPEKVAIAKTEFGNTLLSTGTFKETLDTLLTVDLSNTDNQTNARYYRVLARAYFDMADYTQSDYYHDLYHENGMAYYDSSMTYFPHNSWQYISTNANRLSNLGEKLEATELFKMLFQNYKLNNDESAGQLSSLSIIYRDMNMTEEALTYMIKASIADIKGAKKDALALMNVANALYEKGDIERASRYINISLDENNFYGSNLRLSQITQYLSIIKSKHIQTILAQKRKLLFYVVTVSLLSFIALSFVFIIIKQNRRLETAKIEIEEAKAKLEKNNDQLNESNRIKEEYLGYYFSVNSQMIEKLDALKRSIARKFKQKRFEDIIFDLNNLNINKEKENLFANFDRVFLRIFPTFIEKFNLLLNPEDRIIMKEDQLLNTDLRIFALIRLGIQDNEKIAKILDYSLNTIYSYKTRIKNKSIVPNENFHEELMKIKRF